MLPKQNTYYYQSELQSLNNIMGIVNIVKIPSGIPRTVLIQKEKASRNTPNRYCILPFQNLHYFNTHHQNYSSTFLPRSFSIFSFAPLILL